MLKETLKFLVAVLIIALIVFGLFKVKTYFFPVKVKEENKICIVTEVQHIQIGNKSVYQLDEEWKASTDCGEFFVSRREIKIGDTIRIKILKLQNNDRIFK